MRFYRRARTFGVAYCLLFAAVASGQVSTATSTQPLPPKSYMTEGVFSLPIVISNQVRANLLEVQLYMKTKPSEPWSLTQKVPPTKKAFVFKAPKQGEYWFTVVTVNRQGERHPASLVNEPPGLIVVFDKQAPSMTILPMPNRTEGVCFACRATDNISNPVTMRVYYQTRDGVYRPLDSMAVGSDIFCVPKEAAFTGMVRIIATDLAGNTVSREASLKSLGQPKAMSVGPVVKAPIEKPKKSEFVDKGTIPLPNLPMPPKFGKSQTPFVPKAHEATNIKPAKNETPLPELTPPTSPPKGVFNGHNNFKVNSPAKLPPEISPLPIINPKPHISKKNAAVDKVPATPKHVKSLRRHLVNKPHVALKYEIEDQGPSGVGKVEVYLTFDNGQTWQRHGEDADLSSPVDINLTAEGLVGIRLVVSNGRGFGGQAPRKGEAPDWWVELDVTQPRAELHQVRPGTGADAGTYYLGWMTSDKNLLATAVELMYAETPEGPWRTIAKGLPPTGTYRWVVPQNAGPRAYIRLATIDEAGNQTVTQTPQAVVLDDLSRPRARVVGISTTMAPQK